MSTKRLLVTLECAVLEEESGQKPRENEKGCWESRYIQPSQSVYRKGLGKWGETCCAMVGTFHTRERKMLSCRGERGWSSQQCLAVRGDETQLVRGAHPLLIVKAKSVDIFSFTGGRLLLDNITVS